MATDAPWDSMHADNIQRLNGMHSAVNRLSKQGGSSAAQPDRQYSDSLLYAACYVIVIQLCLSDKIEVQHRGGAPRPQAEVLSEVVYLYQFWKVE